MKLNWIVAKVISAPNFDHFSALEVRAAYLTLNEDKSIGPNEARRFVYSELLKLVKKGWLRKSTSKKKMSTTFVKTNQFDSQLIEDNAGQPDNEKSNTTVKSVECINSKLIEKLHAYKSELLLGLGEADEYKQLCKQFPDMQEILQPQYNQVRERNSKLLGSIKAIETLALSLEK